MKLPFYFFSKESRENPDDYDLSIAKASSFAKQLGCWDLKHNAFPDIQEWVRLNWTHPYGHDVVEAWLGAAMMRRTQNYFSANKYVFRAAIRNSAVLNRRWRNLLKDLAGEGLIPKRYYTTGR